MFHPLTLHRSVPTTSINFRPRYTIDIRYFDKEFKPKFSVDLLFSNKKKIQKSVLILTLKNTKVLEFYKELPFNISGNLDLHEDQLRKFNPLKVYPELEKIISNYEKLKIIDFGCGAGWLVNSLSFHLGEKAEITGVDFNPKAIEYAKT